MLQTGASDTPARTTIDGIGSICIRPTRDDIGSICIYPVHATV